MSKVGRLLRDRGGELDEAVMVLPVLLLISIGLVNLAMLGFASLNAGNAASYGARMGAVAQSNAPGIAAASAYQMLSHAPVGSYAVSVSGSGIPGDRLAVQVSYSVPNYFAGLANLFGVGTPPSFSNTAISYFRQEGW
jgi:hypothetical protein